MAAMAVYNAGTPIQNVEVFSPGPVAPHVVQNGEQPIEEADVPLLDRAQATERLKQVSPPPLCPLHYLHPLSVKIKHSL